MKKLLAAAVAGVFALTSLSSFAVGSTQRDAAQHRTFAKTHRVHQPTFHAVKHKKHKRHHVKRHHVRSF
jgi:hypothetical protein